MASRCGACHTSCATRRPCWASPAAPVDRIKRPDSFGSGREWWRWGRVELRSARTLTSMGVRRIGKLLASAPPLIHRCPQTSTFSEWRCRQNCRQVHSEQVPVCGRSATYSQAGRNRVGCSSRASSRAPPSVWTRRADRMFLTTRSVCLLYPVRSGEDLGSAARPCAEAGE